VVAGVRKGTFFDPEIIGTFLQRTIGLFKKVDDFQEYWLWPYLTVKTAIFLSVILKRTVIIPMTISDLDRWRYINEGLDRHVPELIRVRLVCSETTLRQRILSRANEGGPYQWCLSHIEQGLFIMRTEEFGLAIQTDNVPPEEVAARVLALLSP
jgi:hypothetical protein